MLKDFAACDTKPSQELATYFEVQTALLTICFTSRGKGFYRPISKDLAGAG